MIFDVTVHGILQKCMKLIIHKILLNPQSYNSYMIITIHLYYTSYNEMILKSMKMIVNDNIRRKYGSQNGHTT